MRLEFRGDEKKMAESEMSESEQKIETYCCGRVWEGMQ